MEEYSSLAEEIFIDEGKLYHPGEFGRFRERLSSKLFKTILTQNLEIKEGFIISKDNHKSTQCDLIIYDKINTPVFKTEDNFFVPIETVVGIGEIKSTLSKTQFKEALLKLSENKKIRDHADGARININQNNDFNPQEEWSDNIFSFLICKKLDFDINTVNFDEIYDETELRFRHNLILSVEDGLFYYYLNFDMFNETKKILYLKNGLNPKKEMYIGSPIFWGTKCKSEILSASTKSENIHIKEFIAEVHYLLNHTARLHVDIRQYYS